MSSTKKLLSVFLSVLMILSSVTVGLTALAADDIKIYDGLDENYQALATALQKSYVVDANNYVKVATRDYMATDNEDGDIRAASEAFYNIIDNSEKKRYGDAVKAVDTNLKAAMGSDYTTAMNKAIGNICGNGTISAYTSSLAYKFTVNQNINLILGEYSNASDVPDMAEEKAAVYTYTQTGSSSNYSTKPEKAAGNVSTAVFKDFAEMFSADVLSSGYDALPDGALENIETNGQKIIDAAGAVSDENIKKLLGNDVSIEAAQAYLDGILVFKTKEYVNAVDAIGIEIKILRILILLLLKGLRKSLMLQINFTTLMLRFKKRVLRIHMTIMINIIGFMQIHSTIIRHLNMQRLLNQLKSMQMMHMNLQRKSLPRLKCFLMLRQKNIRYL